MTFRSRRWLRTAEQERTLDDFPGLEFPVLLDDLAMQEGNEEGGNDKGNAGTDTESYTHSLRVGELDLGGSTLPDDEESKKHGGEEEVKRNHD